MSQKFKYKGWKQLDWRSNKKIIVIRERGEHGVDRVRIKEWEWMEFEFDTVSIAFFADWNWDIDMVEFNVDRGNKSMVWGWWNKRKVIVRRWRGNNCNKIGDIMAKWTKNKNRAQKWVEKCKGINED
jgi:hypothetical protein